MAKKKSTAKKNLPGLKSPKKSSAKKLNPQELKEVKIIRDYLQYVFADNTITFSIETSFKEITLSKGGDRHIRFGELDKTQYRLTFVDKGKPRIGYLTNKIKEVIEMVNIWFNHGELTDPRFGIQRPGFFLLR